MAHLNLLFRKKLYESSNLFYQLNQLKKKLHKSTLLLTLDGELQVDLFEDEFKKEYLQIDIDECRWTKAQQESVAKDRVREIEHWSRLKKELDDGSFNTKDVNAHQAKSYEKNLINRKNTLTPGSSQAEVINVLGPLQTLQRLNRGDKLSNDTGGVTIPIENPNRKTVSTK